MLTIGLGCVCVPDPAHHHAHGGQSLSFPLHKAIVQQLYSLQHDLYQQPYSVFFRVGCCFTLDAPDRLFTGWLLRKDGSLQRGGILHRNSATDQDANIIKLSRWWTVTALDVISELSIILVPSVLVSGVHIAAAPKAMVIGAFASRLP